MSQKVDEIYAWLSEKPEKEVIFLGSDSLALFYYRTVDIERWLSALETILERTEC